MSIDTQTGPYCTPTVLLDVVDANQVADCLMDNGSRPSRAAMLDATSEAGRKLARKCREGSGLLESFLLARGRFSSNDLAELVANNGNIGALVSSLAGQVTLLFCLQRRQPVAAEFEKIPGAKLVMEALEALRKGERELGEEANIAAGEGTAAFPLYTPPANHGKTVYRNSRVFGARSGDIGRYGGPGYPGWPW